MLLALAWIFGLCVSVADWTQGYVQSKSMLQHDVFTKPKELKLYQKELVKIIRPVYELADAGGYWHDTLCYHLKYHLHFDQSTTDFIFSSSLSRQNLLPLPLRTLMTSY